MSSDLFNRAAERSKVKDSSYTASDIEVLEGLEPVRRRPGMYIGGTDEGALHHLANEVLDNAMDEAVAGHATRIEIELRADGFLTVRDNGRGIPIDPHPKFPSKSALEVILTTLHSGGKFTTGAYKTSGGLHGVGISVVNALSDVLEVEVIRDRTIWRQTYSRGEPQSTLQQVGQIANRKGTTLRFHPDPEIFDKYHFKAKRLYQLAKSKAYLFKGVEIRWFCDESLIHDSAIPSQEIIRFPGGLSDYLTSFLEDKAVLLAEAFCGEVLLERDQGRVEWALAWTNDEESTIQSFCNTIPTPLGGTHENGLRNALLKAIRHFGEFTNNKKASQIASEDILSGAVAILSVFISNPHFQGQTKEKLVSNEASKLVENAIRDRFDHWLSGNPALAEMLLNALIARAEERLLRKNQKDKARKTVTSRLRLPGKLADCSRTLAKGTELFIVEGDSAGGSAKQARNRETQAILPLRGKILNVANSTHDKIRANQELADLVLAMGCGTGNHYNEDQLRYEKIIIMTDADVDGAHIASLLMTFFILQTPKLIENGHLYLALPPLYRIVHGAKTYYAQDEKARDKLIKELQKKRGTIDVGRFKGLGEMTAQQLRETTMDPNQRRLLLVTIPEDISSTCRHVENLMGKRPEWRFQFIQEQAALLREVIEEDLDI